MVRLESFTETDFPQLISWLGSERLLKEWSGPTFTFPLTADQLHGYLQDANAPQRSERFVYKAIDCETGATVGHVSLDFINWDERTARITRVLVGNTEQRGQGYGRAMINAVLNIGFGELDLQRITLGVYEFNTPAIRCYHRCGFQHVGTLRHVVRYHDEYWSSVEMCLLKDQWQPAQAA